jgi:hypothetical protein
VGKCEKVRLNCRLVDEQDEGKMKKGEGIVDLRTDKVGKM